MKRKESSSKYLPFVDPLNVDSPVTAPIKIHTEEYQLYPLQLGSVKHFSIQSVFVLNPVCVARVVPDNNLLLSSVQRSYEKMITTTI